MGSQILHPPTFWMVQDWLEGRGGGVKALYVLFQLETYTLTFEMSVLVQKLSILLT